MTNIAKPGVNDILFGRGMGTNAHSGNIKFRKLVAVQKLRYLAASKADDVIGHGIGGKYIPIMARLAKARRWSKR